jgi:hypothetical protein
LAQKKKPLYWLFWAPFALAALPDGTSLFLDRLEVGEFLTPLGQYFYKHQKKNLFWLNWASFAVRNKLKASYSRSIQWHLILVS